ncbi:MAG: AbrB/MazE/SpoVT family DNA-binding domain-containing protein [Oscillospiraceae bacterium]|jgi:antitoxin MazE|nr:AbrB/MazE/SpoVT family DNA-binding domain-containing protein [Oscillospiraceae bacterium]
MQTTIQKWGNSQAIRLPKALLELANMRYNERVRIIAEQDKIIIFRESPAAHKSLKERLAGFQGEYSFEEWDTNAPVGREVF